MSSIKTNTIAEFGDYQTPTALAGRACALLHEMGITANSVVEPTCGRGAFLFAAANRWRSAREMIGFEWNDQHLIAARRESDQVDPKIRLEQANFFCVDWETRLGDLPEPLLVIGNPPWVTNSHVSALGGSNLPRKSNFQGHSGLDAITGKANFDISEWMLIRLAEALNGRVATLAMLVKSVVARKVLLHCWKHRFPISDARIFKIDALAEFNAAVDASLLVVRFGSVRAEPAAKVYADLTLAKPPVSTIGLGGQTVVADLEAYQETRHLAGKSSLKWRSGIKHDCSKVMELRREHSGFRNGLGEVVDLEPDFLFPMLKTSEVANGNGGRCTRWMIVTQRRIGDCTADIERLAPKTWRYLQSHADLMSKRGSTIYRDKPLFSIFGVGDYSFAPFKVAISGMYKTLRFVKVTSCDGKPVVLDDVTNFVPCPSEAAADLMLSMLESPIAQAFFHAHVFWDAKRPITIDLLGKMNLNALAAELGCLPEFESHFRSSYSELRKRKRVKPSHAGSSLF